MILRGCIKTTLSKILCKWKQDSAVSLFLYLDSVFKNNYKLIHNQAPVMNRLCPFLLNLHKWKINGLFDCIIRREWKLWFRVLSDFSIQVFNEICSIDYFSDFQRELEENSQIIPIVSPWKYSVRTLSDAAYLHHWLSVTIHFNRYNHSFDKCTECRDKCKPLYFIALHIRVVPPLFSLFVECPLSDTRCWVIGHFRRCVTERLLNTKVVVFLGFLWFAWTFSSKEVDLQ